MRLPSIDDYTYPATVDIDGFTYDLKNAILSNAFFNKEMTHFFIFFSQFGDKWNNNIVLMIIENGKISYEIMKLKGKHNRMKELDKHFLGMDYWGGKYNDRLLRLVNRA
jgi:hypothetical protein